MTKVFRFVLPIIFTAIATASFAETQPDTK